MNSKERVKALINHQPIDKVPLGFYVVDYDIIEAVIGRKTYVRNKIESQIAFWEGRRDEVVESYKKDTVEFYNKIDCADVITFKEAPIVPPKNFKAENEPKKIADDTWQDNCGRIYKASPLANEIKCVKDPVAERLSAERKERGYSVEMFPENPILTPPDESIFEACDYIIEHLGKDRYIAGSSGGMVAMPNIDANFEENLLLYALQPEVVHAANRFDTAWANYLDKYYVRKGQDGVLLEQDMAGSNGPSISPDMFKELCFPYTKERVESIKRYVPQVMLHNCGNNIPFMNMFIEAGIDVYQSLQTFSAMDLGYLKENFGKHLTFWGGVSLEYLIQGTSDDVRKNVRSAMEKGKKDGGFILGPSHSIAKGTPYDNFMAMLDEHQKLCKY